MGVAKEQVQWMQKEVGQIAKAAGLTTSNWSDNVLQLVGQRQCIDDAILLLNNHSEYFGVFEEMGRQEEEIQGMFEALDMAATAAGLGSAPRSKKSSNGADRRASPQRGKKSGSKKPSANQASEKSSGPGRGK